MLIKEIGEFGLIERVAKRMRLDASVIKGSGDDCAVVAFDKERYLLLTCDMLVEGVDFTRRTDPYLIGRKALAVSLSDIAACAGTPRYCLISLGLPAKTTLKRVDAIAQGAIDLAAQYKVNIVGGDISRAEALTIDTSVVGVVRKKELVLRSGAKRGDIIFVTGRLGGSIKSRHLTFVPRLKEAEYLAKHFRINAMIDISDGLVQDLTHILRASSQGAILYETMIPLHREARNLSDALYGGEDFELLFTVAPVDATKIMESKTNMFFAVGEIIAPAHRVLMVDKRNRTTQLAVKGFRHF